MKRPVAFAPELESAHDKRVMVDMKKPNLVLGLCQNYSFDKVEPFISSLLKLGGDIRTVFFATNMSETFDLTCRRYSINVLDPMPYSNLRFHIQNRRFFMYRDFLAENYQNYSMIFLTDVRDVLFQGNPFNVPFEGDVCFAAEDGKIGQCHYNAGWLKEVYGEGILAELADSVISCSGTVMGSAAALRQYVEDMCIEIDSRNYDHSRPNDQAMHNYILYKQRPAYAKLDTRDLVTKTIGKTHPDRVTVQDEVVLVDRIFTPVIHQWDRNDKVCTHVSTSGKFKMF